MIARIFRPAFTVRRSLLVLGTVVVGLVFPAASIGGAHHAARRTAATPPCIPHPGPRPNPTCQIKTTPIHKGSHGFEFTLFFKQGMPTGYGGRQPNSVAGILFKHNGSATENDNYEFSGGLKFKVGRKPLQFAQITGTFAKGRGSINLTFHATGPARHVSVPKGCQGLQSHGGMRRPGILVGSFTLHADKLGTITQKSFKAIIQTSAIQCNKPTHGYDLLTGYNPAYVDIHKASATSPVSEDIEVEASGNGWVIDHRYTASGLPSSDYLVQTPTNLKKATVTGGGGISGSAMYKSTQSNKNQTSGTMSGTLAATFASIGTVRAFPKPRSAKQEHS